MNLFMLGSPATLKTSNFPPRLDVVRIAIDFLLTDVHMVVSTEGDDNVGSRFNRLIHSVHILPAAEMVTIWEE